VEAPVTFQKPRERTRIKNITGTIKYKEGQRPSDFEDADAFDNPRIFVYVIGGMAHHEVVSINQLQQSGQIQAQIVPGSN